MQKTEKLGEREHKALFPSEGEGYDDDCGIAVFVDIFAVLRCSESPMSPSGLHDSLCTQMCILIFAFRSCYCLGSFILQDLFQVSKYLLSRDII